MAEHDFQEFYKTITDQLPENPYVGQRVELTFPESEVDIFAGMPSYEEVAAKWPEVIAHFNPA